MVITVAGGSQWMDDAGYFNIGKQNYLALRRIFRANNVLICAEAIGGSVNRTVRLEISTGKVWVKTPGEEERELCLL